MNVNSASANIGGGVSPAASIIEGAQKKFDHGASPAMPADLDVAKSMAQRETETARNRPTPKKGQIVKSDSAFARGIAGVIRGTHSAASVSVRREGGWCEVSTVAREFKEAGLLDESYAKLNGLDEKEAIAKISTLVVDAVKADTAEALNAIKAAEEQKKAGDGAKMEGVNKRNKAPKRRLHLAAGDTMIRALSGYVAGRADLQLTAIQPKDPLYHGTTPEAWEQIQFEGLKGVTLDFTHLTANMDDALRVGARKTGGDKSQVVLLKVNAKDMAAAPEKYEFYYAGSPDDFQTKVVPARFLEKVAKVDKPSHA